MFFPAEIKMFASISRRAVSVVQKQGQYARLFSGVPSTMKAAVVRETGDADVLKVETDFPVPDMKPDQVLVKNEFSGINFIDTYHRKGLYARDLPFVGGQEGGGIVADVTPEAAEAGIKVGDRVCYSVFGSYAEYTAVPAAKIMPVPESIGIDVAVSCVVQGMTAHYMTTSAHANLIQPGEWCLIHGVGGGTCQWAAQMAKILGYKVIGTGPKGKADVCEKLGFDELILLDETPGTAYEDYESVDIVGIGKNTVDISINSLAHRGIFISFGNASGAVPAFPVLRLIGKSAYVTRPKLLDYTTTREEMLWRSGEIFGWLQEGKLNVNVDTTFPLDQAAEGHKYLEAGKSKGKVLC